jgi:SAM-dependent methyltransferase
MAHESHQGSYVFDANDPTELARLIDQDRMATRAMGGAFAGLTDQEIIRFQNILDLGCGPGGWVLDAAHARPEAEVAGVDSNRTIVDYANARARSQDLLNASFGVMDITQPFDFADGAFDLVNARFLAGVLKREVWTPFLNECTRILRPGGILRLTEQLDGAVTTSASGEAMTRLFYQALWRSGYGFSPDGGSYGIAFMLPQLLRQANYQHTTYASHALEISEDTPAWADFYHNIEIGYLQAKPFLIKADLITSDAFDHLYQQALIEWRSQGFTGVWNFLTAWGYKAT